jgi:hypothetical protein
MAPSYVPHVHLHEQQCLGSIPILSRQPIISCVVHPLGIIILCQRTTIAYNYILHVVVTSYHFIHEIRAITCHFMFRCFLSRCGGVFGFPSVKWFLHQSEFSASGNFCIWASTELISKASESFQRVRIFTTCAFWHILSPSFILAFCYLFYGAIDTTFEGCSIMFWTFWPNS